MQVAQNSKNIMEIFLMELLIIIIIVLIPLSFVITIRERYNENVETTVSL